MPPATLSAAPPKMANKFPSLPPPRFAPQNPTSPSLPPPRFAPQKPSPLSQTPATTPSAVNPDAARTPQASSSLLAEPKPKKPKKKPPASASTAAAAPGKQFATQVFTLVDALKANGGPMNLSDLEAVTGVRGLLSEHTDVPFNQDLYNALNNHDRVNVTERGMVKLWSYRPDYVISTPQQVLELLKQHSSSGGLSLASLKQSWPNVMSAITELENEGKVLVFRTEALPGKEGVVKTVFYDELGCRENLGPTRGALDEEFREMWHALETPPVHTLPQELQEAGLTSSISAVVAPKPMQKKSKKKGRGAKVKITNTHLKDLGIDLSRDYVAPHAAKKP